jgi:acyl carrier protein
MATTPIIAAMTASEQTLDEVRSVLGRALQLGSRAAAMNRDTTLLGNLPELDSMAVVQVLAALEEHYGFTLSDDDLSAETFATLGTLADFVEVQNAV